jgi:hypothetical protein
MLIRNGVETVAWDTGNARHFWNCGLLIGVLFQPLIELFQPEASGSHWRFQDGSIMGSQLVHLWVSWDPNKVCS